jgi:hypothetical protein
MEKDVKMKKKKTNYILMQLIALAFLALIFGISFVSASSITRSFSSLNPDACSTINVSINVDVTEGDTYYIIDEIFPSNWTILNSGTGNTLQAGHIKWSVLSGAIDTQYNYSITAPCSLGTHFFSGEYGFNDGIIHQISGQTSVVTSDNIAPIITILGLNPTVVILNSIYNDAGATATDNLDGNLTSSIITNNPVNTAVAGLYNVSYIVSDSSGNKRNLNRTVIVQLADTTPPITTLVQPTTIPRFFRKPIFFIIVSNEPLSNCKISINQWQTNYSLYNIGADAWAYNFTSLPEGNVTAKFWCTDLQNNYDNSISLTFPVSYPPLITINNNDWYTNQTTNFSYYNREELQRMENVTFTNQFGKIEFTQKINISQETNLIERIKISQNKIWINSSAISQFNKSARLLFNNIVYPNPIIKKDGLDCISDCSNLTYNQTSNSLSFSVSSFSLYEVFEQCSDGIQNYDETGIDCGGSCNSCYTPPSSGSPSGGGSTGGSTGGSQSSSNPQSYKEDETTNSNIKTNKDNDSNLIGRDNSNNQNELSKEDDSISLINNKNDKEERKFILENLKLILLIFFIGATIAIIAKLIISKKNKKKSIELKEAFLTGL